MPPRAGSGSAPALPAPAGTLRPSPGGHPPSGRPGRWVRLGERSLRGPLRVLAVSVAVAVAAGVVARAVAPAHLWLDEAQSVAIARLPVPRLLDALAQDGSPPLYYLLLHGWIGLFGTGAVAVRALSVVLSVLTLPLAWRVTRQLAGRRVATGVLVLLATSPFAIRYASETRMYALLVLLVVLGVAAVRAVVRSPGPWPVAALAAVTGALLLTHLWGFHLVAVVALLALAALRRARRPALRVLTGLAGGVLLFLPWVPTLLTQLAHTGTPWARGRGLTALTVAPDAWQGGTGVPAALLGAVLLLLAALGLTAVPGARRAGGRALLLTLRPRPSRSVLLALSLGTLLVAAAVSLATGSAVSGRYTSVAFPFALALAALGVAALPTVRARVVALAVVAGLGLAAAVPALVHPRTQAGEVAHALRVASPEDVVVFCPDQLGPGVSRLVPPGLDLVVYPDLRPPDRVDWTDYAQRVTGRSSVAVAVDVLDRAGGAAIWVVTGTGYLVPSARRCADLVEVLAGVRGRPTTLVTPRTRVQENHRLQRFAPETAG